MTPPSSAPTVDAAAVEIFGGITCIFNGAVFGSLTELMSAIDGNFSGKFIFTSGDLGLAAGIVEEIILRSAGTLIFRRLGEVGELLIVLCKADEDFNKPASLSVVETWNTGG